MARTTKTYEDRRNEILDVAQAIFYTKGYDQTSIQEILDQIGIAKGTFYHYFPSKLDLLEGVVDRLVEQSAAILQAIVDDPALEPVDKVNTFFSAGMAIKVQNPAFYSTILRVWQADENALFRDKMKAKSLELLVPLFAEIIREGLESGVFEFDHPTAVSEIIFEMGSALSDSFSKKLILLSEMDDQKELIRELETRLIAYQTAMERILGLKEGNLNIFEMKDVEMLLAAS
ncbi:MAG: TetR/AcrR family transcriptional regulator [Anaerolineaceae bacterium]|nr:TetR/AcrR family transcriptional regulator [Anaerolineaceae bacterium]